MKGRARRAARLAAALLLASCASPAPTDPAPLPAFRFPEDTFAFVNQLYWSYDFGPGGRGARSREGSVEGAHQCVAMARSARQFHRNARFAPDAPRLDEAGYRARVRRVLERDPRRPEAGADPIVIPGYASLFEFSAAHEDLLRAELGGRTPTYVQRGNWRMLFPFPPEHQRETVDRWLPQLARGHPRVARVVNFPTIDVNHTILVYAAEETPLAVRFLAYDPNDGAGPVVFEYDRARASFWFPPTPYYAGGDVKLYEIYRDGFF